MSYAQDVTKHSDLTIRYQWRAPECIGDMACILSIAWRKMDRGNVLVDMQNAVCRTIVSRLFFSSSQIYLWHQAHSYTKGKWKVTKPRNCSTSCGVPAGSGTPGKVTCPETKSCDSKSKPPDSVAQCPRTRNCGIFWVYLGFIWGIGGIFWVYILGVIVIYLEFICGIFGCLLCARLVCMQFMPANRLLSTDAISHVN